MILGVFRCSQLFSDVFSLVLTFMDNQLFSSYSIDVLSMFSRSSLDLLRIFPGCFHNAPMGLVGLVEFDDHFK